MIIFFAGVQGCPDKNQKVASMFRHVCSAVLVIGLGLARAEARSTWVALDKTPQASSFIDKESLTKKDGVVRVKYLMSFRDSLELEGGIRYKSMVLWEVVDCNRGVYKTVFAEIYADFIPAGNPIWAGKPKHITERKLFPDVSIGYFLLLACK